MSLGSSNDIKPTIPVNYDQFIGMHVMTKPTAYNTRSRTLYGEYQSIYWGKDPDAGLHMVQKYGLDRIFTAEEIQSLNYERAFQIPTERLKEKHLFILDKVHFRS